MLDPLLTLNGIAALASLVAMEIVLGIDNLIFIAILVGKVDPRYQDVVRRGGIFMALLLRLALLACISWIISLTAPVFNLGIEGAPGPNGIPSFETAFSWRDLILLAGGLFLVWKSISEIHVLTCGEDNQKELAKPRTSVIGNILQIMALDMVFSVDSILTAIGMTDHLIIMMIAVIIAMCIMLAASKPVMEFINANPTIVMLALSFLLMIGVILIAEGFGHHVPKGYVYFAILFACMVEFFNQKVRKKSKKSSQ